MKHDTDTKTEAFFAQQRHRHYDKGQVMIHAGDAPGYIFYLKEGIVRKYDVSYRGDEIVVNVFKPGSFFPMSWAINNSDNQYFYQASTPVEVYLGSPEATLAFIKDNPDVLLDLLSRVYAGTDGMLRRMVHLMGGSAKGRLMYELLIESRRFGKKSADGACVMTITETELAARTGLSRETVNREFRKLINSKMLIVAAGKITIHDMSSFEDKLGKVV